MTRSPFENYKDLNGSEYETPSPPGTCNLNLKKLENAAGEFGALSRVEKAAFRCISACNYFRKRPNTHRDMLTLSLQLKKLDNAAGNFGRLLRIKYTLFRPISIYLYLGKWPCTHHVRWWRVPCCHA